jgi:hypothetical protein
MGWGGVGWGGVGWLVVFGDGNGIIIEKNLGL